MKAPRDLTTTVIAAVHLVAALLHLVFWVYALSILPPPSVVPDAEQAQAITRHGFAIADLVWSVPLLALASAGLWRVRDWGWTCAQLAHVLYGYSFTIVLTRDYYTRSLSPGTVLFGPFALFSIWAAVALWRRRTLFFTAA